MPRGDQKQRVMQKRALDEPGYYAFASLVGAQRHFNVLTARMLEAYGLNPLDVLDGMGRPMPADLEQPEVMEWVIQESACPMTILRAYVEVGGDEQPDTSVWGQIASQLVSTTEASLRRWGDKNHLTPQLLRRYCEPGGMPLDVQAMNLSETAGVEIPVEEFWQFILAHPRGQQTYQPQTYGHRLAEAFQACAGFRLTYTYAVQLLALIRQRNTAHLPDAPF